MKIKKGWMHKQYLWVGEFWPFDPRKKDFKKNSSINEFGNFLATPRSPNGLSDIKSSDKKP